MADKFGKFLLFTAAIGAAVAGTYYYTTGKNPLEQLTRKADDDFNDDFDDDAEDSTSYAKDRRYVSLDREQVSKNVKKAASEAVDIAKSVAEDAKSVAKDVYQDTRNAVTDVKDIASIVIKDGKDTDSARPSADSTAAVEEFFDDETEEETKQ